MLAGDGKTNVSFLWTSLDGAVDGQSLPSPVIGVCRNVVDQIVLGGAPHTAAFRVDYGQCTYHCRVRDDAIGGYKIVIVSECGCTDRRSFLMTYEGGVPSTYYAARPTGLVELIDPTEGTPRPDPDLATFTKGFKVPKELRSPPESALGPGDYTRTSSMYSGQMRKIVGCYHLSGRDSPFSYTYTKTHGVVEFPQPRVAGATGKFPPGKKFWLVELSAFGAFAMPFQYRQKCCDLPKQFTRAMPTDAEIAGNPSLQQFKTELNLSWAFVNKPNAGIVQLISAAAMAVVYAKGDTQALSHGWAFSYSGHEASNVVFTAHNTPDNFWEIWHPRVSFTTANPSEGVFTITAAVDYLASDVRVHNNVNTLMWFQSETYPGLYEQFFPFSFNAGTTISVNYADVPVYVLYHGDQRRTLTMSSTTYPSGFDSGWSDAEMFSCINNQGFVWTAGGCTERQWTTGAATTYSMSFSGTTLDGIDSSNVNDRTICQSDPVFEHYAITDQRSAQCCGSVASCNAETWARNDTSTGTSFERLGANRSGGIAAVLSQGDRESLFLCRISSAQGNESLFTQYVRHLRQVWTSCWANPRNIPGGTTQTTPLEEGDCNGGGSSTLCIVNDLMTLKCNPNASSQGNMSTSGSYNESIHDGHAFIGSNNFPLPTSADYVKFLTPKNPVLVQPTHPPGPIGYHGNLFYNEPSLVQEGVTIPTANYVLNDGTNGWTANGGFSLTKPGGGSVPPRAFVGRV